MQPVALLRLTPTPLHICTIPVGPAPPLSSRQLVAALMQAKERSDPQGWLAFQTQVSSLKLQRSRLEREAEDVQAVLDAARRRERQAGEFDAYEDAVGQWDRKDAQARTSRWVGVRVQLRCGCSAAG